MRYKFLEGFLYNDKKKFLYVVDQQNYIFKTLLFNPDSNVPFYLNLLLEILL